jgi:hypothetical protein
MKQSGQIDVHGRTLLRNRFHGIQSPLGERDAPSFEKWVTALRSDPTTARKSGSIIVFDKEGSLVQRYRLLNAWPSTRRHPAGYATKANRVLSGDQLFTLIVP